MKLLLPAALAFVSTGIADAPRHVYEAGRTLRVSTELSLVTETVEFEMIVNGEPREGRGGGQRSELTYGLVHTDRVVDASEGAPTRVVRTFEQLSQESMRTFGEDERIEAGESPFEGLVLELVLDEDGELELEVLEGSEPDAELLEGHALTCAVDGLLAGGELEPGAEWDLEPEAMGRALTLDLERVLFPPVEREEEEGGGWGGRGGGGRGGVPSLAVPGAEWEGVARLTSLDGDYDGLEVAVIELEFSAEGDLPEPEGGGFGGGRAPGGQRLLGRSKGLRRDNSYTYELEGTLYYSVAEQRPVALELAGTLTSSTERLSSRTGREMEIRSTRVGEWNQTTLFEIVEDDQ